MKKRLFLLFFLLGVGNWQSTLSYSWGFYAHKRINRIAVFTLPKPLFNFYKSHIDHVTEHAVDADRRRYATKDEAPRHYIDIDHFGDTPFTIVPRHWDSAVGKLTEDTLLAYGIVPWHVNRVYYWLVKAFEEKNLDGILRLSSDIGHYIADAHVPLHTTENYNGQMTGQKGIHGFWESRLPELYGDEYDYLLSEAMYIPSPLNYIWDRVYESHMALDSVLGFEKELSAQFSEDDIYAYEERGAAIVRVYSRPYSKAYHQMLNGMVERRMRSAIHTVASFWLSAWVDAGQPILDDLMNESLTEKYREQLEEELKSYRNGNWKGRPEPDAP